MTYHILPCCEYRIPGAYYMHVERPREGDAVEFWGVYARDENGIDEHVADFNHKDDAELFANIKNTADELFADTKNAPKGQ